MPSKIHQSLYLMAVMTAAVSFIGSSYQASPVVAAGDRRVAAALEPIIPQLRQSKTPVYLPAWLPSPSCKSYPSAKLGDFGSSEGEGYSVVLAVKPGFASNADTLFYLTARKGSPGKVKGASKVDLGGGRFGYYRGGGNFHTLDWSIGKYSYHIGIYAPQAELVKIAKSMVRIKFK